MQRAGILGIPHGMVVQLPTDLAEVKVGGDQGLRCPGQPPSLTLHEERGRKITFLVTGAELVADAETEEKQEIGIEFAGEAGTLGSLISVVLPRQHERGANRVI